MQDEILKMDPLEKAKLMSAVNELCVDNPEVVDQLEKLAKIKKEKPFIWLVLKGKIKTV